MHDDMDICIQQLAVKDMPAAEALASVMISAWQAGFQGILPETTIEKYTQFHPCTDMFRQIISSGIGTMYLARLDGQAVGLLYWIGEGETARIEALLTVPEVWGTGIAAQLMHRALQDSSGFPSFSVWPFAKNHRARRFYEKHGFSPTGRSRMGDAEEVEYLRTTATI